MNSPRGHVSFPATKGIHNTPPKSINTPKNYHQLVSTERKKERKKHRKSEKERETRKTTNECQKELNPNKSKTIREVRKKESPNNFIQR